MSKQRFASVWDAIENTPEAAENMKLRSVLMTALKNHLARAEMNQAQAARLFGVTQPRISDLMRGKINLFGLDALVNMATAAGLHIDMRIVELACFNEAGAQTPRIRAAIQPAPARKSGLQ